MRTEGSVAVVTGAASGLGYETARQLLSAGASVVLADRDAEGVAKAAAALGQGAYGVACDVTADDDVARVLDEATARGPLRVLVHCAGRGGPVRVVTRDGEPGSIDEYVDTVRVNLVGSFNMLRLTAARMAAEEPEGEERGVCVLTASVAAYEGQVGQVAYASSKAGIVGMTLVAARDLGPRQIRVCAIAPGVFETPMMARVPSAAREKLHEAMPHPRRLGNPEEFAALALHIVANPMLNGETIRLDGALRMGYR